MPENLPLIQELTLDGPLRRIIERQSPWIGVHPRCDMARLDVCGHCICIPTDWDQDTVRCGECRHYQETHTLEEFAAFEADARAWRESFSAPHKGESSRMPSRILSATITGDASSIKRAFGRRVRSIPAPSAVLFWLGTLVGWLLGEYVL